MLDSFTQWVNVALGVLLVLVFVAVAALFIYLLRRQ
jgi:hypothetical protein